MSIVVRPAGRRSLGLGAAGFLLVVGFVLIARSGPASLTPSSAGGPSSTGDPLKQLDPQHGTHPWTYPAAPIGTIYYPSDGFRLEPADGASTNGGKIRTADDALAFLR